MSHEDPDTAIGGRRNAFPETRSSAIHAVRDDDPVVRARAFASLVRAYWKPVYRRIRLRFGKPNEDAKDLTQGFFATMLARDAFAAYRAERGRFRTYVRTCLDNYVRTEERRRRASKRSGGEHIDLALAFEEAELEIGTSALAEEPQYDSMFDRDWVQALHRQSLETLRRELEESGRAHWVRVFERYDLVEEPPTYAQVAQELGLAVTDVTNYLHHTRKRFRRIVLEHLRELTVDEDEFRAEARELLGYDPDEA